MSPPTRLNDPGGEHGRPHPPTGAPTLLTRPSSASDRLARKHPRSRAGALRLFGGPDLIFAILHREHVLIRRSGSSPARCRALSLCMNRALAIHGTGMGKRILREELVR